MIYYPLSLPEQPVYAGRSAMMPTAKKLAASVLSLPIHTEMDEEQLTYIVTQIKTFFS
jgi:dTDP-4-amino-4,6-dideoxygalactose transaminase